jgi:hypothetical protein
MLRRALVGIAVALGALALPVASADAARVRYDYTYDDYHGQPIDYFSTLRFVADPGEQNDLTVRFLPDVGSYGVYEFHDSAATIQAAKCDQVDAHTVRCDRGGGELPQMGELGPYAGVVQLRIELGDGNDAAGVGDLPAFFDAQLDGGAGNDALTVSGNAPVVFGSAGDDTLNGGAKDDVLVGGTGRDTFHGGGGDDQLGDDGHERDVYDGGPGLDFVSYTTARRPVTIDLGRRRGPQGDSYSGVENAQGGTAGDTILGDGGANDLRGGPGPDHMNGRGGPDLVDGERGYDRVTGGAGRDHLYSDDSDYGTTGGETVHCGAGADVVTTRDSTDGLARDCERTVLGGYGALGEDAIMQPLRLVGRTLRGLGVECSPDIASRGCKVKYELRVRVGKRNVKLGHGSGRGGRGEVASVPVDLATKTLLTLPRGRDLRVAVAVRVDELRLKSRAHPERGTRTFVVRNRFTTFMRR